MWSSSFSSWGDLLFRWRLAVIVGSFGVAALCAMLLDDRLASTADLVGVERAFLVTSPLLLVAFLLRVAGEARLGAAVYGQEASARVITGGPFRFSRHPLYVGTWLFFVAGSAPYVHPAVLAVLALVFAVALAAIGAHEERALAAKHGDAWTAYARAVPRFLGVPRGASPVHDDGVRPTTRDVASAVAGNLFFLSLAAYRACAPLVGLDSRAAKLLGLVNLACLVAWLVIVGVRRLRS